MSPEQIITVIGCAVLAIHVLGIGTTLIISMVRSDRAWSRKAHADLDRTRAMFDALPKPKDK